MIQANELRIGNKVYFNLMQEVRVITISYHEIRFAATHKINKYQPLPLTHEILEKAGFKNIGQDDLGGWTNYIKESNVVCGDVVLSFGEAGQNLYVKHSNNSVAYCLYLHQLQNLYFALTGEELEIKL